jgi:hypothetical protein
MSIINNNQKYQYKIFDITKNDKMSNKLEKSFITEIRKYSYIGTNYKIKYLYNDAKNATKKKNINTYLLVVFTEDEELVCNSILSFNRIDKTGIIQTVYTNEKYRGQKFCQLNINLLIKETEHFCKKYTLNVVKNNNHAIKCYIYCGFKEIYTITKNDTILLVMECSKK